jgi:probable rRNA maturation factor
VSIVVEVIDETELGVPTDGVAGLVRAVLDLEGAQGTVVVAFVDEETIKDLNARDRGLSEPTDVLSYCARDEEAEWTGPLPEEDVAPDLGEVIVCPALVRRYAEEGGRDPGGQLAWTIMHGVLHVLGYDHERDAGEMRRREQALLEELLPLTGVLSLPADS